MLLWPASGLLYSQKPKACSLPVAPCTLFQDTTGPQVVRRCRTCRAGVCASVQVSIQDVYVCAFVHLCMCQGCNLPYHGIWSSLGNIPHKHGDSGAGGDGLESQAIWTGHFIKNPRADTMLSSSFCYCYGHLSLDRFT